MKRLTFAFCILLILSIYNWYAEKYILDFCDEISYILESCANEIKEEKYSQAESTVSKLYNLWEENDVIMSVFIGDDTVIEPQESITSIRLNIEDKNYKQCLVSIRECQGYIHEITENNRTSFGNVL